MRDVIAKITDFHKKNGFGLGTRIGQVRCLEAERFLTPVAAITEALSIPMRDSSNARVKRVGYILEETGELSAALATGDEVAILDALADLIYVVAGTAVEFGLPLPEAFDEVHRSNMSKSRSDEGFRDKGPDYTPPDIAGVLKESWK